MDVEAALGPVIERSTWQGAVHEVVCALRDTGRVAVTGVWGAGKTTLLARAMREARGPGRTQVWLTCADGDQDHAFGGVEQLLSAVAAERAGGLPLGWEPVPPLPGSGPATPEGIGAARRAVAGLLGTLSGVDLAVDGAQWLDSASANVLEYAVRTVGAPHLAVVVSERTHGRPRASGRLLGGYPVHVPVPTLDLALTSAVVARHGLPHRAATTVFQHCGGHRLLTETVCAELAARHPCDARTLPSGAVQAAVAWLATLPVPVRRTLLLAALARRPTVPLLERAGCRDADDHVRVAVAEGVLCEGGPGEIRFTAQALAAGTVGVAGREELVGAHRALARAEADPVHVVRHRALSWREGADQSLAEDTAEAAGRARADGERALSAELFLLAAELTPVGRPGLRMERLLSAVREAAAAGDSRLARRAADAVGACRPATAEHVGALLAVVDSHSQDLSEAGGLLERCRQLAAGAPRLMAAVELRTAILANVSDDDPHEALRAASTAAELAQLSGQPGLEAAALTMRARMERVLGSGDCGASLGRALALDVPAHTDGIGNSPQYLAARHAVFDDRLAEARTRLTVLLAVAEQRGRTEDLIDVWRSLAEVEVRSGACVEALTWAGKALEASVAAGLSLGPACYTAALAQSAGGSFAAALRYATYGEHAASEEGDGLHRDRNLWVAGTARLHTGDVGGAAGAFGRLSRAEGGRPPADPSVFRWQPDAVEAFVAAGDLASADQLMRRGADTIGESTATGAGWLRARAFVRAHAGDTDGAVELLHRAADVFHRGGLPLEEARTHLVRGRFERARRRQAAARGAFQEAEDICSRARSRAWLAIAREHLGRLDGQRRLGPDRLGAAGLTDSERRLADLVRQGATNQEAAQRMYISVKTVESMLSRVYRKLRIRSRIQLAAALTDAAD